MDKFLNSYEREHMRMTMLKHEETFIQQVHELYRLYRIQKILMSNNENKRPNPHSQQQHWRSQNGFSIKQIDRGQQTQDKSIMKVNLEHIPDEGSLFQLDSDHQLMDESEIKLTLGPALYNRRNYKKPETPPTSDSGPSFSSSSTASCHISRSTSLPWQTTNKASAETGGHKLRPVRVPDMSLDYLSQRKTSIDVEERLRPERLKQLFLAFPSSEFENDENLTPV